MNIHEHMAERMELAGIYATDGGFRTAASILRELADDIDEHVERCDRGFDVAARDAGKSVTHPLLQSTTLEDRP